jgi:alkyldihydroxyacetonephosphate synthase
MNRLVPRMPIGRLPAPTPEAQALLRELAPLVEGRASNRSQDRICYSRDLWPKALIWARAGQIPPPPDVVVWPANEEQVVQITRRAGALGVPLIPFGAGSGVCGGTVPLRGGILMDLKRMNQIRSINLESLEADCEVGIIGERLERQLNRNGVSTGHFPSSMYCSSLGGWIAARGAGQCSNRYGKMEDMVASVTAVDGRGELFATPRRPLPGWDLTRLLVGSEGALATLCSARLHLVPLPQSRAFQAFRFRSVARGVEALREIFRAGVRPAVARLYDPFDTLAVAKGRDGKPVFKRGAARTQLDERLLTAIECMASRTVIRHPIALNKAVDLLRECLLLLIYEGSADLCELEAKEASRVCLAARGEDRGPEPARAWLQKRYAVSYKQSRVFDVGSFVDTMEVAGTWDKVMPIYEKVREALAPLAFVMCHFSHAYVEGCCLYFTFAGAGASLDDAEERYDEIWRAGLAAAREAGATASHHHGIGLSKLNSLKGELGDGMRLVRALKTTLDPKGIMNPGKLGA